MKYSFYIVSISLAVTVATARGTTILVTEDFGEWATSVDDAYHYTDFTEQENGTWLSGQYTDWGILFTDFAQVQYLNPPFVVDGVGVVGFGNIDIAFEEPIYSFAIEHPNDIEIRVFYTDGTGGTVTTSGVGDLNFIGIVGDAPIDWIEISGPGGLGTALMDNLYIGHAIVPAPGAIAALPLLLVVGRRSRG